MMETHIWTFINKTADIMVDLWYVEPRIAPSIFGWSPRIRDNEVRLYMNGWSVYGD